MRTEQIRQKAREMIDNGEKPSVSVLAEELGFTEPDVHRCLNSMEKDGGVETYTREVFGRKHRMISLNR